mmetsp:Transcript_6577/g.18350  ORF Transcript_6577/g.18350 Transcript_6577/m.18350 type:complete len:308 (-) Transcript_6577:262-1185(-)
MLEAAGAVLLFLVLGGVGIAGAGAGAAGLDRGDGRGRSGVKDNLPHYTGIASHGILHPVDLLEGVPGGGNLPGGHVMPRGNLVDVLCEGIGDLAVGVVVRVVLALIRARRRGGRVRRQVVDAATGRIAPRRQTEADPLLDETRGLHEPAGGGASGGGRRPSSGTAAGQSHLPRGPPHRRGPLRHGRQGQYHGRLARQRRRADGKVVAIAVAVAITIALVVGCRGRGHGRRTNRLRTHRRSAVVQAGRREAGGRQTSHAGADAHSRGAVAAEAGNAVDGVRMGADGRVVVPLLVEDDDAGVEVGGRHD